MTWTIITSRPMTDEEVEEYNERTGYGLEPGDGVIYTCELPEDGQEVLVYNIYGRGVSVDTFCDDVDGCYFEEHGEMDGIVAWMPLPEPPEVEADA